MRKCIIVSSPNAYRMNTDLISIAIEAAVRRHGYDVLQLTREAKPPGGTSKDDLLIFCQLGVPELFRESKGKKIIFNFHPTCPTAKYGHHALRDFHVIKDGFEAGHFDHVLDYNPHTTEWMKCAGISAVFCPIGYSDAISTMWAAEWGSFDDVLFIGRAKGKRSDLVTTCGAQVVSDCWGYDRQMYTRRKGIHLSLASYQPFRTCLTLRLITLLASSARVIVHERTDWCPLVHEEHCLIGGPEELPGLVDRAKSSGDAIDMANRAFRFISNEYRFDDLFTKALQEIGVL